MGVDVECDEEEVERRAAWVVSGAER